MITRPPTPTLFPTRRSSDLPRALRVRLQSGDQRVDFRHRARIGLFREIDRCRERRRISRSDRLGDERSEEHTSELQSRQYLVCRLLLEKKKDCHTDTTRYIT